MKPTIFSKFTLPTLLLFAVILSVPGCQLGKFSVPSFPGASIWKKDHMDLSPKELATPSSQFSPEYSDPDGDLPQSAKGDVQQKVDKLRSDEKEQQKSFNNQPIRQPYSLESINPELDGPTTNGFEPLKTPQRVPQSLNTFPEPDNGFQNLQNTLQQLPQDVSFQENPPNNKTKNSIPGWHNEFAPGTVKQTKPDSPSGSSNRFQPVPPQPRDLSNTLPPASQGLGSAAGNNSNGFDLSTAPGGSPNRRVSPAPNNLLQPAPPTSNNLIQTDPNATVQLPLLPIQQEAAQPIAVPDGGTVLFGGGALGKPNSDNSFGPIPFNQPNAGQKAPSPYPQTPYPEFTPGLPNAPSTAPGNKPTGLPVNEPATQPLEKTSSPDIPAVLRTGNGGFAPGSTKQLKPVDQNGQLPDSSN